MVELLADGDNRAFIQNVLAVFICGAALIWGGTPERIIAAAWLIFFEASSWLYRSITGNSSQLLSVDVFYSSMDVLVGAIWIVVALYANRNYPLWIAGLQILAITAHLSRGLSEIISPMAYLTMSVAPGWVQLLLIATGLIRHIRRKNKHGPYRDWRRGTWFSRFDRQLEAQQLRSTLAGGAGLDWREKIK